jgi:hypothetical protein
MNKSIWIIIVTLLAIALLANHFGPSYKLLEKIAGTTIIAIFIIADIMFLKKIGFSKATKGIWTEKIIWWIFCCIIWFTPILNYLK